MLGIRFELKQVTFLKNIVNFVHTPKTFTETAE